MVYFSRLICFRLGRHDGFIRLLSRGWGVRWKDTRHLALLLSERNGRHKALRLGPWYIRILEPMWDSEV